MNIIKEAVQDLLKEVVKLENQYASGLVSLEEQNQKVKSLVSQLMIIVDTECSKYSSEELEAIEEQFFYDLVGTKIP